MLWRAGQPFGRVRDCKEATPLRTTKTHTTWPCSKEKGKLGQFEVFGMDVIVDADQRVYMLEANRDPSRPGFGNLRGGVSLLGARALITHIYIYTYIYTHGRPPPPPKIHPQLWTQLKHCQNTVIYSVLSSFKLFEADEQQNGFRLDLTLFLSDGLILDKM